MPPMSDHSKKQRKLDFRPSQKRKSLSSTPVPSSARSSPQKAPKMQIPMADQNPLNRRPMSMPGAIPTTHMQLESHRGPKPVGKELMINGLPMRQAGPRRLVVKDLRPATEGQRQNESLQAYFEKRAKELDDDTFNILQGLETVLPYDTLYTTVQELVKKGKAAVVVENLERNIHQYMTEVTTRCSAVMNKAVLDAVVEHWTRWMETTIQIRSIFKYLDTAYLVNIRPQFSLLDRCINIFRHYVLDRPEIKRHVYPWTNALIDLDRCNTADMPYENDDCVRTSIQMLTATKLYKEGWEPLFLASSKKFFDEYAQQPLPLDKYVSVVTDLVTDEAERCEKYGLQSTTRLALRKLVMRACVEKREDFLTNDDMVGTVMKIGDYETIKKLYNLFKLNDSTEKLKEPWEAFIKNRGTEICADEENSDRVVNALLDFKILCQTILAESFDNEVDFKKSLRSAFCAFINSRNAKHPWGNGGHKVGELLAKYADLLLRGGLNAVPESLVSLSSSPALVGEALEAYKAAEFDRQIDMVLDLFRYIDGKDTFFAYYKIHLARRLLHGRCLSREVEMKVVNKFQLDKEDDYFKELMIMFYDIDGSIKENKKYNLEVWKGRPKRLDLSVTMLTQTAWPTYPEEAVKLPHTVAKEIERFDDWYGKLHSGRKVTWRHSFAHAELRANLPNGKKYLVVQGLQAIVLILFNDAPDGEPLSYAQIQAATDLPSIELDRTLSSLACGKQQILIKDPVADGIAITDTFRLNLAFSAPTNRVKIPQVALRETRLDSVVVAKHVALDRDHEIQGAIVRALKKVYSGGKGKGKTVGVRELLSRVNEEIEGTGRGRRGVGEEEVVVQVKKMVGREFIDEVRPGEYVYLP